MKNSVLSKLDNIKERHYEIEILLSDSSVISNKNKFRDLSQEYAKLEETVQLYNKYLAVKQEISMLKEMLQDPDPEIAALAKEDLPVQQESMEAVEHELQLALLPTDPRDNNNVFLEIRAGTGGDEAAIFVGNLFRCYSKFAEKKGWTAEIISLNESDQGGYKEVIVKFIGDNVYGTLKFESGCHRVQRIPETESQGRIHTSACTVAVLPEIEDEAEIDINPADLRIDTFRASGAGGQHVNKTDSAVRITHVPTGTVVECQDERSQHKNKAKAMSVLGARLQAAVDEKKRLEQEGERRSLVGSGDRSDRIRTYNYPQGRVTDHRINLTLYRLTDIIDGDLDSLVQPLLTEYQADLLMQINSDE